MFGKRGQATLFIILGIVLVVIVVLLFTTKTIELPRRFVESSQVSPVGSYVESCVSEEIKPLLLGLKKQGGMVYPGAYYLYGGVPYYYIVENIGGQFAKHIEDETFMNAYISWYVRDRLLNQEGVCDPCLKFSELSGCGNFDVSTISNDNGIIINAKNDNLKLGRGEGQIDIGDMSLVIDDYFFREYKIVKKIADENMQMAWFDVYSYIQSLGHNYQYERLNEQIHVRVEGSPVADEKIKLFYVWLGDGTEEEVFYFAIKK